VEVYGRYLKKHPAEVRTLFKELLINVTSFFRDPEAFVALKQDVLPQLLAAVPLDDAIRVWVVGCATGEEAYSIAMLLREFMDETHREFKVQIYSTDLDDDAIAIARAGVYPPNVAVDLSAERLRRFFVKEDAGFRVKKEIREMVVFAVQNVIKDPPFTKLNLVSCRNLLIYLEPELQDQLIRLFHYSLLPGGVLFLSPSESIGTHPDLFQALNRKWKLYRTLPSAAATRALIIHERAPRAGGDGNDEGSGETLNKAKVTDFSELTRRALLQSYAPASVLVDTMGNILFVYGETGKYLRPAPGQASLNVVDMARDGLQPDLRLAVHAAATQGTILLRREVSVTMDGAAHTVRLSVRPLAGADRGNPPILVCFEDVASPPPAKKSRKLGSAGARDAQRIEELERELVHARDSLRATIEEAQTSHEDGKSANEELQSTNEELQSTNEELETSKEELQSVNEELTTVNAELQAKVEQLIDMQNDMKNLLDNVNVGTIFLNQQLLVRRFTREAQRVYRLVPTDVGRPLADIKSDLSDIDLMKQAQQVLDTLVPFEREVRTDGGASFLVRIQPYRTLDNVIDGVVLTYTDITQRVKAQAAVEAARNLAEGIVNTVREPLVVLDSELRVVTASRSFYQRFRAKPEETLGRALFELGDRQWDIKALRDLLQTIVRQDEPFENLTVEQEFPSIGRHQMLLNARRVIGDGNTILVLLAIEDVSGKA
jgi:two-component system, chemotaxis family, CheB/CheR fusion protein